MRGDADAHVAGVLLLAIAQLQGARRALPRGPETGSAGARDLQPFIRFLPEALTTKGTSR